MLRLYSGRRRDPIQPERPAMPRVEAGRKRCAIYTRKSSEEGLEQEFNSLAAQREACEAYIRSQQHEGWVLATTRYDDGGFSGGNLERLALNVLLSFAQFEREVTGERIRDKIAASKKKGMWMGGNAPLGYDADKRALMINPAEAETVRRIFALYREHGCVRRVKDEADRLELRTKRIRTANG